MSFQQMLNALTPFATVMLSVLILSKRYNQYVYLSMLPMCGGVLLCIRGEINYNANLGNLSELAECSDRGLDDGDGQCECFDGFRGLACEEQEALV